MGLGADSWNAGLCDVLLESYPLWASLMGAGIRRAHSTSIGGESAMETILHTMSSRGRLKPRLPQVPTAPAHVH